MTDNVHDDVEAYALDALERDETIAFEQHLAHCAACRAELGSYAPVLRALRGVAVPEPPRLPAIAAPERGPRRWLAVAAAVALLVAGAGGGAWFAASRDADTLALAAMEAQSARDVVVASRNGVRLRLVIGEQHRRTAIVLAGAGAPPPGRAYQVWVHGTQTQSPGLMHRSREGLEILLVDGDVARNATSVGVSVEPAGGSAERTGTTVLAGKIQPV